MTQAGRPPPQVNPTLVRILADLVEDALKKELGEELSCADQVGRAKKVRVFDAELGILRS